MRVEIVSISKELLLSDILNTNAAYVTRVLREAKIDLSCKITVDAELALLADVVGAALRRSDVVLALGGLSRESSGLFAQAVSQVTNRALDDNGRLVDATFFNQEDPRLYGWYLRHRNRLIINLPGNRKEMAYLLETYVLPVLRQMAEEPQPGWLLLRTVGTMESTLKETLGDLQEDPRYLLSFDSFAGQTTIRLAAAAAEAGDTAVQALDTLRMAVYERLGDNIFGEGNKRLEDVVLAQLENSGRRLAIAECFTDLALTNTLETIPIAYSSFVGTHTHTDTELAEYLRLGAENPAVDLTRWNRLAAQRLREKLETDLGLIVYNKMGQGGVQVMATLASPLGVSVTQRSFGGHPSHINQWACTLGLAHLRRWLLVYA